MTPFIQDWLNLLIRWAHFVAGIMWIGSSFYFVWLDSSFEKPKEEEKGVDGELYMVHGGNFYRVEKRRFGAGEMPQNLHWFKWEATFTWITGFLLLIVTYYLGSSSYLFDSTQSSLSVGEARFLGISLLAGSWFFYDALFRLKISDRPWFNFVGLSFLAALIYVLTHFFSGRGAFIHLGAIYGTMMVLNVWVHILPNQRAIIDASLAGREPNYDLGKKAKRRSMHNSYMTLPVLFMMISNHFPSTYAHRSNGLILVLFIVLGAFVRHYMITLKKKFLVPAFVALGTLISMTAQVHSTRKSHNEGLEPVRSSQVMVIIKTRCTQCHASNPSDDEITIAPNDLIFESIEQVQAASSKIYERVVLLKNMPLNNKTKITEDERDLLGRWIEEGAKKSD